jgi:hypothetical protein
MFRKGPEISIAYDQWNTVVNTRLRNHCVDELRAVPAPKQLCAQPASSLPEAIRDAEQWQLSKVHRVLTVEFGIAEEFG